MKHIYCSLLCIMLLILSACSESPVSISKSFMEALEKGETQKCQTLYPQCSGFINTVDGKAFGEVLSVDVIGEEGALTNVNVQTADKPITLTVNRDWGQIVGSLGLVEDHNKYSFTVIQAERDFSDYYRMERINFIESAQSLMKEYFDAMKSFDLLVLEDKFPQGPYWGDFDIDNVGDLIEIDLNDFTFSDVYSYACHKLTYQGGVFYVDNSGRHLVNPGYISRPETEYADSEDSYSPEPAMAQEIDPGFWEKDYFKDEFGDENLDQPYIKQGWDGQHNGFDCHMQIRVSNVYGVQFGIMEDFHMATLTDVVVRGQLNGEKFDIEYDDETNGAVTVSNQENVYKILNALETQGTFKLSFRRTDAFGETQTYIFTIYGPTHVSGAIEKYLKQ